MNIYEERIDEMLRSERLEQSEMRDYTADSERYSEYSSFPERSIDPEY